jgi:hypothetical protein
MDSGGLTMCDSAEHNWVWTLRDRRTGQPLTTADGYTYYFQDEAEARALAGRLPDRELETVQVREPGV